jgi:hypothetical protein
MSKSFTTAEVAQHKDDANGYWLIVEGDVYDVSSEFPSLFRLPRTVELSVVCAISMLTMS